MGSTATSGGKTSKSMTMHDMSSIFRETAPGAMSIWLPSSADRRASSVTARATASAAYAPDAGQLFEMRRHTVILSTFTSESHVSRNLPP